jgi:hypothetical protein
MPQLPGVHCWIKVIGGATGRTVPNGKDLGVPGTAVVRYVVANDSDRSVGPLWIVGSLHRDGVRVRPGGRQNVVAAQQITLQPREVWKHEHEVSESGATPGLVSYSARILADGGTALNEHDESNSRAQQDFGFLRTQ